MPSPFQEGILGPLVQRLYFGTLQEDVVAACLMAVAETVGPEMPGEAPLSPGCRGGWVAVLGDDFVKLGLLDLLGQRRPHALGIRVEVLCLGSCWLFCSCATWGLGRRSPGLIAWQLRQG